MLSPCYYYNVYNAEELYPPPVDSDLPPLPPELPPLPAAPADDPIVPPAEPCEYESDGEMVEYQVLSEVGADDGLSCVENAEPASQSEGAVDAVSDGGEGDDSDDLEELERLAQRKMEILKAIELPDSVVSTSCCFK